MTEEKEAPKKQAKDDHTVFIGSKPFIC